MDNAIALTTGLAGLWSFLVMLVHALFVAAQPALDIAVPAGLAYLAHRYVRNQTAAKAVSDMAAIAYLHLGSQYASLGKISFSAARQVAIEASVAGVDAVSKAAVAHLTKPQINTAVAAQLGTLLANDATFVVTDPTGSYAALQAQAAALAQAATAAAQPAATDPAPVTSATVTAPNFDIQSFVQEAVRQGIEAAQHNGVLR